tara:strand:+ start:82 stop:549 length:468 start_codon:yes stop_codon:yes gene_type:complete
MPAVKFTYQGGRTPRTFTEHMSKLRAAANKAANAAEFKAAVNKVGRIRKNRRELKQRIEQRMRMKQRMRNYIKRLPKNHIGKKLPKADLNKLISRLSPESNGFNNFKRIIERGPRFVYPRSRLPNGKYTTNRANWTIAWWKAGHPQLNKEYNYYK